ncbi:hypothetical protein ACN2CC_35865 (plasmid) [Mesorhizobium muleiense]|uniref:hypothetical protein n=1 Tax=Mesorhizobium muleiense TaxID=1004279 RepID=UPI003AFAE0D5
MTDDREGRLLPLREDQLWRAARISRNGAAEPAEGFVLPYSRGAFYIAVGCGEATFLPQTGQTG